MVILRKWYFCVFLLLCTTNASAEKANRRQRRIDISDVLNPDPNAPDADHTGEYSTDSDMLEGDMKVPENQQALGSVRNAASDPNKLWPGGVVPYVIDSSAQTDEVREVVRQAIADYAQYTCIKFLPRKNEVDYVRITTKHAGCWSLLGREGGEQELNLGRGCVYKGTTMHEMMHAIGFEHEQKRGDRDNYVQIHFDNIPINLQFNFKKIKADEEQNMGLGYDFSSIMHYGQLAFAKDYTRPTITTKDSRNQNKIGQRAGFSKQDVKEINLLYKCRGKNSGVKGKNGCLDKHRRYCEDILKLKYEPYPECDDELKKYCMVSCHACNPGDGRGISSNKPRPERPCKDQGTDYCENTLSLKNGPNRHCNYPHIKKYCRKSCNAC